MALEALSSNDFLNFIIYDTVSATPCSSSHDSLDTSSFLDNILKPLHHFGGNITTTTTTTSSTPDNSPTNGCSQMAPQRRLSRAVGAAQAEVQKPNLGVQGRKKRKRKPRVCKNKEEAETQRMTHIAVERNRRKQMNEHLAVLKSLMPESYVQRGDQASIVGGAIEFVKELEHLLQTIEAQKLQLLQGQGQGGGLTQPLRGEGPNEEDNTNTNNKKKLLGAPPFAQFFVHPQYTCSQMPNKLYTSSSSKTKTTAAAAAGIADIEVTLIETHANLRILSRRRSPKQLSRLVAGFQTLYLNILHINVTTMDPLVLYSISAKVEEGCQLTSVDDIAGAVHHMLRIIEEEAAEASLC